MITNLTDFFAQYPDANTAFEALGCFFPDPEAAAKFLGGTSKKNVILQHDREKGIVYDKLSDEFKAAISGQIDKVNAAHKAYDEADRTEKNKAMELWTAEDKKLKQMQRELIKCEKLEAIEIKTETKVIEPGEAAVVEVEVKTEAENAENEFAEQQLQETETGNNNDEQQ